MFDKPDLVGDTILGLGILRPFDHIDFNAILSFIAIIFGALMCIWCINHSIFSRRPRLLIWYGLGLVFATALIIMGLEILVS